MVLTALGLGGRCVACPVSGLSWSCMWPRPRVQTHEAPEPVARVPEVGRTQGVLWEQVGPGKGWEVLQAQRQKQEERQLLGWGSPQFRGPDCGHVVLLVRRDPFFPGDGAPMGFPSSTWVGAGVRWQDGRPRSHLTEQR